MSNEDKKEAARKAALAKDQLRHAANNAGDAAEAAAEHAKDEVVDAAGKSYEGIKGLGRKLIYTEMGRGALSFVVGAALIGFSVKKFSDARSISQNLAENLAKADHHIRSDG